MWHTLESREFPIAIEVLRGPYSNILYHSVSNSESYACSRLQSTLRNPIFPFLNRELFDLRNIYVGKLKTGCSKKKSSLAVNLQIEIFLKSRFDWNKEVDELETESIIWL